MTHDPAHKPDLISREAAALACYAVIPPLSPWDEAHRHAINLHHVYSRIGATPAAAWRRQIETNGGPLDAGEVATRIQKWMDRGYRLVNVSVKILGGEALSSTPVAASPAPDPVVKHDARAVELVAKWVQAIVSADRWKGRSLTAEPPEKWHRLRPETRQFWLDEGSRILDQLAALTPAPVTVPDAKEPK